MYLQGRREVKSKNSIPRRLITTRHFPLTYKKVICNLIVIKTRLGNTRARAASHQQVDRYIRFLSLQGMGLCAKHKGPTKTNRAVRPWSFLSMCLHLMIPFAFLPGITESWLNLSSHFVTGLKVVSIPRPFEEGSSDLITRPSLH